VKGLLKKKIPHDQQRQEVSNLLKEMEQSAANHPQYNSEKFKLMRFMDEMSTYLYTKLNGTYVDGSHGVHEIVWRFTVDQRCEIVVSR
jgi:hypothetical protein